MHGRPICSTSMRTIASHIRPPSPTQNPWRFRYPLTTQLTILTYCLDYPHGTNISGYQAPESFAPELCCSVCGNLGPSLAGLEPCTHLLCSACLTSALNIVGEKDMECAVCKTGVANFHLRNTASKGSSVPSARAPRGCLMPGAFDGSNKENLVNNFHFFDLQGSSMPNRSEHNHPLREGELLVLRIVNVPWVCTLMSFIFYGLDLLTAMHCYCRISHLSRRLVEAPCKAYAYPSLIGRGRRIVMHTLRCSMRMLRELVSEPPKTMYLASFLPTSPVH